MNKKNLKTLAFALLFAVFAGAILAYGASVFVPRYWTAWAGAPVCPGTVEFVRIKQSFYCFTSANDSFEVRDAMFWSVFKRLIIFTEIICFIFAFAFMKTIEFLWKRREAAGF